MVVNQLYFFFYLLTCQLLHINIQIIYRLANYGVVLLLGVVSWMAGSATGVPTSPGYGGYRTATPPPYYTATTYDMSSYYIEASKYYTTKFPD